MIQLREAAESLQSAGMSDAAEQLRREASRLDRQVQQPGPGRTTQRADGDSRTELDRLRREVEESAPRTQRTSG